ncbi:MAG: Bro-N domain-containing protein [Candidatus Pacebacteria bacterium]|jgi:prophage antirepressor-like protein|nr:Bro-N domain-containing protein [Candidatus Paceibacterota bacterium]
MKKPQIQKNIVPAIFEATEVRRVWHDEQWYFAVSDVVRVLSESKDVKQYIKKMRTRDPELSVNWGTICTPLDVVARDGKKRVENMSNLQGMFRIIQSISSPKAEPFKQWLAKVGQERIDEMVNPEIALNRSREYWKKHGRSDKWIQQRMMGQETRNKLTDYWKSAGVEEGKEYAILTNIIHQEWSGLGVQDHKKLKGLGKTANVRDHMSEAELIFTALAELSTRQIAENTEAKGLEENKIPAQKGGKIAKDARLALEEKTGRKVVTGENYLPAQKSKKKLK